MAYTTRMTRRNVLQAAALLTPIAVVGCTPAIQLDTPELRAGDPVARSLLYYPDTREVPANNPLAATHSPAQKCANCIHVRGEPGDPLRPCPIFAGRLVNANGWCSVWAAG
jgi:hypothetical protein